MGIVGGGLNSNLERQKSKANKLFLVVLLFLAPCSWGTPKREAAAPKASGYFMGGTSAVRERSGKQEAAKLPGAGIGPKQCPAKCAAEKGKAYRTQ